MKRLFLENENCTLTYYGKRELWKFWIPCRKFYEIAYSLTQKICNFLRVDCPDICISSCIRTVTSDGCETSIQLGRTITPKQYSRLKKDLIILSLEEFEIKSFMGTIAHEVRHLWQEKYVPEINKKPAMGFSESLFHPAEIDADAFAIFALSNIYKISFEKAAEIICPEEKKCARAAYWKRLERAKSFDFNTLKEAV